MKTIRVFICFVLFGVMQLTVMAQTTSSGKSFSVDYDQWCALGYPGIFINCGNDPAFNTGSQLTLEVWARAYIFGENRKIMGKMSNTLNNGYVLGFENLNIYTEIMNPDLQVIPHPSTGPMPADSAWVHIATTFDANGQMINYLNGVNVGEITVFPQTAIASNSEPFVIGLAPWDLLSYEFTGDLDEVRVWNVARTQQQIRDDMFRTLKGDEAGLVACYNFNSDNDSVVHDLSPNALNGLLKNSGSSCFSWATSYAPVGDAVMSLMHDLNACWFGKDPDLYMYAVTTNGLSMISEISDQEFRKYVVFGHDNRSGKTNADAPATAPADFERLSRVWYVNQGGGMISQIVFNIQDAAGGGATLNSGGADSLYTLLVRDDSTGAFTPLYAATNVMGNTVLFDGVALHDKYYTLGYSSERLAVTASVEESANKGTFRAYPNPVHETLYLQLPELSVVSLSDMSGRCVFSETYSKGKAALSMNGIQKGVYVLRVQTATTTETQKIILQ